MSDRIKTHPLGTLIEDGPLRIFFGDRNSSTRLFRETFPQWSFFRLKQVHGDLIHRVTHESPADYAIEGDASLNHERKIALCVITADCMPVFIFDPESKCVAGIHAGWRGVAARIVPKVLSRMNPGNPNGCRFFLGPHIMKESFEVNQEVRDLILSSVKEDPGAFYHDHRPGKSRVDLHALVRCQIREIAPEAEVTELLADTMTDPRYHSFRRDRENSGRQVSFIVLE